jgi:uncharacterized protein YdcH (DUF465 family)
MVNNILDLAHEFPEFKDAIHNLKISDAHFARLYEDYNELCKSIYRAEQRIDLVSEEAEEALRKDRVKLKDELYAILSEAKA